MKKALIRAMIPLALIGCGLVQAEGVRMYRSGEVPDSSEIADILRGHSSSQSQGPKMRGISLDPAYQPQPKVESQPAMQEIAQPADAFSLPIQFEFNSSEIRSDARPQLDAVAEGIKMVSGARVVVEGHTDAYGSADYNERLSFARANSVKRYLVSRHGIDPYSLIIEGKGEREPIQSDPYAPENRRVQFRAAR